jgi:hypothetical protein
VPDARQRAYGIPASRCASSTCTAASGALEPVHGRARDLRVAAPERQPAARLRGRPAAPRLRQRARRRAGACRLALENDDARRNGLQHRQRQAAYGHARSPPARWRVLGKTAIDARRDRELPRATSVTASPTSRGRDDVLGYEPAVQLRRRARRARRLAEEDQPVSSRIASPRRRRARSAGADGMSHFALVTGGAGFVARTSPTASCIRRTRAHPRRLRAAGRGEERGWLRRARRSRLELVIGDVRDVKGCGSDGGRAACSISPRRWR